MGDLQCTIEPTAYGKVLLHASKHFSTAVQGILIGEEDGENVKVLDTVAVNHGQLALAPMMEAALAMIDKKCQLDGTKMVGYYEGCELLEDRTPGVVASRVCDCLKEPFPQAFILMIDNDALTPGKLRSECALRLWVKPKGRTTYSQRGEVQVNGGKDKMKQIAPKIVDSTLIKSFNDFDDHCDDVSRDFFNANIEF
ncbi:hypothetical protein NDN08_006321 [Rhodosorus marinus]|uniref:MPN domain-containing protein n=1 Tax=Rhodosorus marinus TaxID=101924 RepID=A0AAV8UKC9_9RHOD|nr:hypothetical protein NDN08_006321 [Rhodosorus marinus]